MNSAHIQSGAYPFIQRVRRLATVMIGLMALFFVYWSINIIAFTAGLVFGDGMQSNVWVDEGVMITMGPCGTYLVLWPIVVGLTWSTFYAAFQVLQALWQCAFFAADTCRRVQVSGAFLIAIFVIDTALAMLALSIVTWNNSVDGAIGFLVPTYHFDSTTVTLILCCPSLFIVGWVLHEGAQTAKESEGFI